MTSINISLEKKKNISHPQQPTISIQMNLLLRRFVPFKMLIKSASLSSLIPSELPLFCNVSECQCCWINQKTRIRVMYQVVWYIIVVAKCERLKLFCIFPFDSLSFVHNFFYSVFCECTNEFVQVCVCVRLFVSEYYLFILFSLNHTCHKHINENTTKSCAVNVFVCTKSQQLSRIPWPNHPFGY